MYLDPKTVAYVTGHWPEENGAMRYEVGECWGTKEREECNCGGDTTKCTFYKEVRENAIVENKKSSCEYCDFEYPDHEYNGSKELPVEIIVDGKKECCNVWIEENPDYDHFINITGTYLELHIPISHCPKCGRKL